jgi:hypothetical protein
MGGMVGGGGKGGGAPPAPSYGSGAPGANYTNPRTSAPYTPSYTPQTATPFLQSIMAQHSSSSPLQQGNSLGLPSLQSMFNMPQRGAPYQASGIQQLAPYVSSTYRPNMNMSNLNNVAPFVRPEQVSELDNQGKPITRNPIFDVINNAESSGG